jgi:hypothetical protein
VDHITFDVIFRDRGNFERVRDSGVLAEAAIAALFRIDRARITLHCVFEPANAIKFTLRRLRPSGSPGESDVFGAQQYAPLFDVMVP